MSSMQRVLSAKLSRVWKQGSSVQALGCHNTAEVLRTFCLAKPGSTT